MNITRMTNKMKIAVLPKKQAKEVSELYEDMLKNTSYNDVKVQLQNRENIKLIGKNGNNSLSIDLDFKNNKQTQVEKTKAYVFSILYPVRECVQEIRGTIDGTMKRVRTTRFEHDKSGADYLKTTDYENLISGNKFRREESPNGVKFYRNIDGDFVEMFSKK